MAFKDGDVVRLDYTLFVDGKPVETNQEDVAKRLGIVREGKRYQPLVVSLGAHQVIPGLESHIRSHGQVGQTVKVELAAADAYGERKADKVRDVPMGQFKAQKVQPQPGMSVNLGGERGLVTRMAGGRVRVDLNHELAGKPLTYEYTVRDVITDDAAKVDAVLSHLFQPGSFKVKVAADEVELEVPDAAKFDNSWMMAKFTVVSQLRAVAGKRAVKLVEVFPAPAEGGSRQPGHEGHQHE